MTATNHAAAGAIVAIIIKEPVLALPLAFVSHFLLDTVPHFGYPGHGGFGEALKHRLTYLFILLDVVGFSVLAWTLIGTPWLAKVSAFLAITPDLVWVSYYFGYEKRDKIPPGKGYLNFHSRIQWCERPWGIWIEVAVMILLISLVLKLK